MGDYVSMDSQFGNFGTDLIGCEMEVRVTFGQANKSPPFGYTSCHVDGIQSINPLFQRLLHSRDFAVESNFELPPIEYEISNTGHQISKRWGRVWIEIGHKFVVSYVSRQGVVSGAARVALWRRSAGDPVGES